MQDFIIKTSISLTLLLFSTQLYSHGNEKHEKKRPAENRMLQTTVTTDTTQNLAKELTRPMSSKEEIIKKTYQTINNAYLSDIKPIFEKKCFDCHGVLKNKPWYYDIPGISYMIQKDIKESKEHMDMRKDFPFVSHESPYNDLKSIKEIGLNGGMPPLQYIIGHWDSKLTDNERKKLLIWSEQSMKLIEGKGIDIQIKSSH